MHVLTVYAHPNPKSFCHAVVDRFTSGLRDAGHTFEVVDLYAIEFNPVFGLQDYLAFADDTVPREILESMQLKETVLSLSHGPIQKYMAKWFVKDKDVYDLARALRQYQPEDVRAQQAKVASADGIALVSPVYWMGFPAILKGWLERVFNYGFAYALTEQGWHGEVAGRVPLLKNKRALIINATFFSEANYKELGFEEAIHKLIDEWSFKYPGFRTVDHEYFHAPHAVSVETRQEYLDCAYRLGREFDRTRQAAEALR
jgi:NAD(P)H dehydrogenase (quinone)